MTSKVFKTLEEQVEILESKGLVIKDVERAKEILLRENYFFINGYRHVFLKQDVNRNFIEGATFEEMYALFQFDRQLRNVIFKNLLIVENNYKSIVSYVLSRNYGYKERDYLRVENFTQDKSRTRQVNDLIRKMKRQIRVNGGQHSATLHYINNYGYIPLWIVVKVLSFGIISEVFSILKEKDKEEISDIFMIDSYSLEEYLPILANYRNLCAHEDILYDHFTQRSISDTTYHRQLNIDKMDDEYIYGKNDIFALIIILKQLLSKDDFKMMMNEIAYDLDVLDAKIDSVDMSKILDKMGFPSNYKDITFIS